MRSLSVTIRSREGKRRHETLRGKQGKSRLLGLHLFSVQSSRFDSLPRVEPLVTGSNFMGPRIGLMLQESN